jgi:hypothetical protein
MLETEYAVESLVIFNENFNGKENPGHWDFKEMIPPFFLLQDPQELSDQVLSDPR